MGSSVHFLNVVLIVALNTHSSHATVGCNITYATAEITADCHRLVLNTIPFSVPNTATTLNLSSNRLTILTSDGMLSNFTNLRVLDVSHNYLTEASIPADLFSKLPSIYTVHLQRNRIRALRPNFLVMAQIRILKLDENIISHVGEDFLVNITNLEELSLANCGIETISPNAFRSMRARLKVLDLSNNRLDALSKDVELYLFTSALQKIMLYGNFWACNCHLRWLREAVDRTQAWWVFEAGRIAPSCEEPRALKHKNWLVTLPDQYGCPPQLVPAPEKLFASEGNTYMINCTVITYVTPTSVLWLQDQITTDYKPRLSMTQDFNGSILTTVLTVTDVQGTDFVPYECIVNTSFGFVKQTTIMATQPHSPTEASMGVLIAIVAVVILVLVILLGFFIYCIKRRLVYRGKLYTNKDVIEKSEHDLSLCSEGVTVVTPLTSLIQQPDVIKCYPEDDDLTELPVETEYPVDDAGCKAYNEYLELVVKAATPPPDNTCVSTPTPPCASPLTYIKEEDSSTVELL